MFFDGLIIGFVSFLIIGIYHPIVIKGEYYFGTKIWWLFLFAGVGFAIASVYSLSQTLRAIFGVCSFSSFWGILEVFHQRKRVLKGWFPMNPKRKKDYDPQ